MDFNDVVNLMMFHHEQLKKIGFEHSPDGIEGNIYTYDGVTTGDFMKSKMINVYNLAQECKGDVLEIGFNAGNSALIFLMANPTLKFHAVDLMRHLYVKPCVEYLNRNFNNRVILHEGDSLKVVPGLDKSLKDNIDIYHIDGWHAEEGIKADMKNCYELAKDGAFVIVDDCNNKCIQDEYDKYISEKKTKDRSDKIISQPLQWEHRIAQYTK